MSGLPGQLRPIYKITIKNARDGKECEFNSWYYALKFSYGVKKFKALNKLTIYVDRDLDVPLDMFRIRIATGSASLPKAYRELSAEDIKPGATVRIYLGYARGSEEDVGLDEKDLVFTGLVDEVSQDFRNIVITGYSNAYKIIFKKPRALAEKESSNQSSSSIVENLLDKMVAPDSRSYFQTGMEFHSYVPDVNMSIYENIKKLADYNGFDLYFSRDGKLRFCEYIYGGDSLEYAKEIVDNSITMTRPPYDKVTVQVSHEPGKGDDNAWQISSEPLEGVDKIGNSKVEILQRQSAIIKDQKKAEEAAKNKLARLYTPESGSVTILGDPHLELGQSVSLKFANPAGKSAPGARELSYMARTNVKVTRITHKFNMRSGFVTALNWVRPPDKSKMAGAKLKT